MRELEVDSYRAAHHRVVKERGKASTHPCADYCGRTATGWSLRPGVVAAGYGGSRGRQFPYSNDPADYDPLCGSCHRRRDH